MSDLKKEAVERKTEVRGALIVECEPDGRIQLAERADAVDRGLHHYRGGLLGLIIGVQGGILRVLLG